MSHNPRLIVKTSINSALVSHRGCQVIHDSSLHNKSQITRHLYILEKYLWANLTTLLAIYDKDDNLIQRFDYVNSRMPISVVVNSRQLYINDVKSRWDGSGIQPPPYQGEAYNKYYLHYDQVGTLRAVSDINHNIIKEITYDTFGNILSDSNPDLKVPFGFAGGDYNL